MKKILIVAFTIFSLNAFSQSYVIMDNGITLTTDSSGYAYDFGHYAFPQKIILKGGQYFVEEGGILATIDENGLLFRKYELIPEKIKGKGMNYFISDEGFFYAIDKKGFVKVTESEKYIHTMNFGGNFFTLSTNPSKTEIELYVVTGEGIIIKTETPGLNPRDIVSFGGSFFMSNRGIVYTIATNGLVKANPDLRVGIITKKGGNYFTDSSGSFFTISETGDLIIPALPINMKINTIQRLGSNYFIDQTGKFFVVDKGGQVFERVMRDHDFRLAKIISL